MFIWVAVDLSEQLKTIRDIAIDLNKKHKLNDVALLLPQHLSLKISFFVPNEKANLAIELLQDYLKKQKQFSLSAKGFESQNGIVWLKFNANEKLEKLHNELDVLMLENFNVKQHEFDLNFAYHSTLFINLSVEQANVVMQDLKNQPFLKSVNANSFIIGTSPTGKAGTYSVIKTILV